jgi:hypothetical protein
MKKTEGKRVVNKEERGYRSRLEAAAKLLGGWQMGIKF